LKCENQKKEFLDQNLQLDTFGPKFCKITFGPKSAIEAGACEMLLNIAAEKKSQELLVVTPKEKSENKFFSLLIW